jgi:ribosomal protein L16 Arg81 hydroxylase
MSVFRTSELKYQADEIRRAERIEELKAQENHSKAVIESNKTRNISCPPNSVDMKKNKNRNNETERQLANLANVGHTAYHQAKTILDSDNEEVKQKVLSGDLSINAGRCKIFSPLFYIVT